MSDFREVAVKTVNLNPFQMIGGDWMLLAAEKAGKVNAMTASWGGMGTMWDKPVAFAVIRPQRYTKEFVDGSAVFSLNFLDPHQYRQQQNYMGTVSGRDEDKIAHCGFSVLHDSDAPYFGESRFVLVCRKLFAQPYDPSCFIDKTIEGKCYPSGDFHTLYIAEVIKALTR